MRETLLEQFILRDKKDIFVSAKTDFLSREITRRHVNIDEYNRSRLLCFIV